MKNMGTGAIDVEGKLEAVKGCIHEEGLLVFYEFFETFIEVVDGHAVWENETIEDSEGSLRVFEEGIGELLVVVAGCFMRLNASE